MKIKSHLFLLTLVIILFACKKKSAVTPPSYDLIVEGGINTFSTSQYIRLSQPALIPDKAPTPLNGATVTVNDGDTNTVFTEINSTGIYWATMKNNQRYNQAYTLSIIYQHKAYTATDTLFPVVPIDERHIPITFSLDQSLVRTTIPKHTFGALYPQQWLITADKNTWDPGRLDENYPYSYSHPYGSPDALNPLIQQNTIITSAIKDSLTVYKFSLSNTYATFLYTVFQETDWRGILSGIPGNVKGNISGNANGFFYARDVEMKRKSLADLIRQNQQ